MKIKCVNKSWLEAQVSELNAKLNDRQTTEKERLQIEQAIHYYIGKLVEMDENGLIYIEVQCN